MEPIGEFSLGRMDYNICMAFTIKVSKPGYEVQDETDARNFIFDSDYNHLKTAGSGSFQKTLGNGASTTQTVAHGLDYRPLLLCYWMEDSEAKWRIASVDPEHSELRPGTNSNVTPYCDDTNVYFEVYNGNGAGGDRTYTIKYEYFYEGDE